MIRSLEERGGGGRGRTNERKRRRNNKWKKRKKKKKRLEANVLFVVSFSSFLILDCSECCPSSGAGNIPPATPPLAAGLIAIESIPIVGTPSVLIGQ